MSALRYDAGTRFLHWLVVLLLLAEIPAGIAMIVPAMIGDFPALPGIEQATIDALYAFHKGMGVVLLVVILIRVLWRLGHRAPPLPDSVPPLERTIAARTHVFLYVLMVTVAASGYVHVVGLGFPIELLDRLGVPPLIPRMEGIAVAASFVHRFGSYALVAVAAIHVAEVLRTQWVAGEDILGRMWPPFGGGSGGGATGASLAQRPAEASAHDSAHDGAKDSATGVGASRR